MSAREPDVVELHVVSDATGETATRVVAATEAQFPEQAFVDRAPPARRDGRRPPARARADGGPARGRDLHARRADAPLGDARALRGGGGRLLRPARAAARGGREGVGPQGRDDAAARRPPLDEQYFKRIAAIEFAVKNDDGLGRALDDADVVLVGVSRTSKTPLSIYLGYLGWKATNVPLVKGIEPPGRAVRDRPGTIVGLTIDAERLAEIRSERLVLMGGDRRYAT